MGIWFIFIAAGIIGISGLPGLLLDRRGAVGQWIAAMINILGSCIGGAGVVLCLAESEEVRQIRLAWSLPAGQFALGVDALSSFFLIPILLVSALGSIYGLEYWKQADHARNGRKLRLAWGVLTASMMLVVLARDAILFLMAWEVMALAAYFLVTTEDRKPEVRQAGWVYLIAAHLGTLCLFALFGLLRLATGSFDIWSAGALTGSPWLVNAVFVLGVVGFGLKAGIVPLHVWLPGAHSSAPSHVSAILSGVLLKTGVYGVIRVASLLPHPPGWWGGAIITVGCASALLGIIYAVAQHDYKRLLAYSSIENVGIIMIGVGLAMLGRSFDQDSWIALGMGGALFHVLGHSLFKPMLFMAAGSVLHATNTRQMDRLGGLAKQMPVTSWIFILGAVAISGLPPLNGFVSEFLIYSGLFGVSSGKATGGALWAAIAAPVLAMVGALSIACFVKLLGAVFWGSSRSSDTRHAHDPGILMRGPMIFLAIACALVGVLPTMVSGVVDRAVQAWHPGLPSTLTSGKLIPFAAITYMACSLVFATLAVLGYLRRRRQESSSAPTWGCGYIAVTPRIQYTGSSFAQTLTVLFGWALLPRKTIKPTESIFARSNRFLTAFPDIVLDRALVPTFSFVERVFALARPIHRGPVQVYLLYVCMALLVLFLLAWW